MDPVRFDTLAKSLSTSRSGTRRAALRTLVTVAAGSALGLRGVEEASAVVCSPAGSRCLLTDPPCCSGRCPLRKGKFLCRQGPSQGICTINEDTCQGTGGTCGHGKGGAACSCFLDFFGRPYCGIGPLICNGCATNKDCPKGHFCSVDPGGCCSGSNFCAKRCPRLDPMP
jgi:hypothetical protein